MNIRTNTTFNIKHAVLAVATAGLLLSALVMPMQAQAQSSEALRAQIEALLAMVAQLRAQIGQPSVVDPVGSTAIGERVRTTSKLMVRFTPAGTPIGVAVAGLEGEIIGGSRSVAGHTWWHIAYDSGLRGWSAERWIEKIDAEVVDDTWDISDVSFIEYEYIDPYPTVADEEYTLYTVVLTNDVRHTIEVCGFCTQDARDQAFREVGYTGDIQKLIALAQEDDADQDTTETTFQWDVSDVSYVRETTPTGLDISVYVVELTNDVRFEIRTCSKCSDEQFEKSFREVGYTGDIQKLIALAQEDDADDDNANDDGEEAPAVAPGRNDFSCANNALQDFSYRLPEKKLVCYGVWDFGAAFGNDRNMCGGYSTASPLGCQIKVPACASGVAEATDVFNTYTPWDKVFDGIPRASKDKLQRIAERLDTTPDIVSSEMIRLWEYRCTAPSNALNPDRAYNADTAPRVAGVTASLVDEMIGSVRKIISSF